MAMSKKTARALGIVAGLSGEGCVWRDPASRDPKLADCWRRGWHDASWARAHDAQQEAAFRKRYVAPAPDDLVARSLGVSRVLLPDPAAPSSPKTATSDAPADVPRLATLSEHFSAIDQARQAAAGAAASQRLLRSLAQQAGTLGWGV